MSEKYSFKDWKFSEWIKGNWKTIKEALKIGIPFLIGLKFVAGNPLLILAITAIGKFLLDAGQYYVKKQ